MEYLNRGFHVHHERITHPTVEEIEEEEYHDEPPC
jgi:hypothetical protein